ncbi:hypothetical protein, partial [Streptomyces sp. Root1295]|uniref:hypothetical protein n=1 Tax=Streptomyces sp. Root1295 TaxID=1736448 RepID=UPI001A7E0ECE
MPSQGFRPVTVSGFLSPEDQRFQKCRITFRCLSGQCLGLLRVSGVLMPPSQEQKSSWISCIGCLPGQDLGPVMVSRFLAPTDQESQTFCVA